MPLLYPRVGRPGLIGTAARTAVITGTAAATSGAIRRRQAGRAQEDYERQQYEAAQQQAAQQAQVQAQVQAQLQAQAAQQAQQSSPGVTPAAPAASAGDDLLAQLERLGQLHAQGVLDDAEFTAAKGRLLGA